MKLIVRNWKFNCPGCDQRNIGSQSKRKNCAKEAVYLVGEDHRTHWFLNLLLVVCTCGLWLLFMIFSREGEPSLFTQCTACGFAHQPSCSKCGVETARVDVA